MKALLTTIVAFLLMLVSSFAQAHQYGFSNQCDVQVNAEINIKNDIMQITLVNGDVLKIDENGDTWKNNKRLALSASETALTKQYRDEIYALVPEAMALASEALAITNLALTEVFTGLFGEDSDFVDSLNETLKDIEQDLRSKIYQPDGSMEFGRAVFSENGSFSNSLSSTIENAVDDLVSDAMGEFMMLIGRAIIGGDSDLNGFQARMETLGDELDAKIDQHSQAIESSADSLCNSLKQADNTESSIQNIQELKDLNLIKFKQRA